MTKKITYIAYNGTEFEAEQECKEYEQYAIDMATQLVECYSFFDKDGVWLPPAASDRYDNFEDFCEQFENTYNDCDYIVKRKDCPESAEVWAINEFGFYMPEGVNGIYRYDLNDGKWLLVLKMA